MTLHQSTMEKAEPKRPPIILTAEDHEKLSTLARAATRAMPEVASALADELDRAQVLAVGRSAQDTVRMGSVVEFRDETTGRVQSLTLVYPEAADISQGKISILTPVGAALIGLHAGHSITWRSPKGDVRRLTVLAVHEPPAA